VTIEENEVKLVF